ncbi:hypothetical protein Tco_0814353 [Tanacetum coccineum]
MAKPILNDTQTEKNLVEPRIESDLKFEFSKELLTELRINNFSAENEKKMKFYPLSCASNYDKMCDDDDEKWGNEEGLLNDKVSSDEEWEEHEYGNPPKDSFPIPYFESDKNDHNKNNRDAYKLSGMDLSGAPQSENINNEQPNEEVCRVDKFEVIKYTIRDNEEFLAIYTREYDSWARTVNGVSSIYHDIFRKKDDGWTVHRTK